MCIGGGGGDSGAAAAAKAEKQRQAAITQGTQSIDQAFAGFNPDFYTGQSTAYSNYALPQLDTQYADAKKQLAFALERSGLSASTAGADQQRKLEEQYAGYKTDVANNATNYAQKSQSDIENSRANLISQLNATEDPTAASTNALRIAQEQTAPPAFDPVGQFAFNISQGLANQNANQGYTGLLKSPLFQSNGAGSGSVSYSR